MTDMNEWIEAQRALGWKSYPRAVYALHKFGIWERDDDPPKDVARYLSDWYQASRWAHSGVSPEEVQAEIERVK